MLAIPFVIFLFQQSKLIKAIGPIALTYACGILFSLILFLLGKAGVAGAVANYTIGSTGSFIIVAIAIPLILFSTSLKEIKKLSKKTLLSWLSLVISVIITTTAVYYIFGRNVTFGRALCAMAAGLYTGGTPNLNALGGTFGVDSQIINYANLSDMIFGGIFYLFLLSICKPLLSKILKAKGEQEYLSEETNIENYENVTINKQSIKNNKNLIWTFLIALGCCAISAGVGIVVNLLTNNLMFDGPYLVPCLMGGVTVLGIVLSFNKKVAATKGNYALGQYLILVFSFAISSVLDFNQLSSDFFKIFLLFMVITVGILIIHTIISKIFKLDVDVTMITMTAGIYGPAFIPAITKQIKNDKLTAPGLICGSIGYAIGTFLGMLLYLIFR